MNTNPRIAALVLRLALSAVFFAHGLFKLLVLGMPGTVTFFEQQGFPGWTAYAVTAVELIGAAALLIGFYTRTAAVAVIPVLIGAFTVHGPNGWYFGAEHGGWEYLAFLIAASVAQAFLGGGALSLDSVRVLVPQSVHDRQRENLQVQQQ